MLNILHNYYADNHLNMYGGGVQKLPGNNIKFTYTSRGRIYNHSIMDDVEVKYSSMDPDLFEEGGD